MLRQWALKLQQMINDSDVVADVSVAIKASKWDDELNLELTHPFIAGTFVLNSRGRSIKLLDPTRSGEFFTGVIDSQNGIDIMLELAIVCTLARELNGLGYEMEIKSTGSPNRRSALIIEFADRLTCHWYAKEQKLIIDTPRAQSRYSTLARAVKYIKDY